MANHLPRTKKIAIIRCLVEGCSVRSTSRIVGCHKNTILNLLVDVGRRCRDIMDEYMVDLTCKRLEFDELWTFVHTKQRRLSERDKIENPSWGDNYVFTALDPDTKLMPAWLVGKRNGDSCDAFVDMLAERVPGDVQITTDGFNPYVGAIRYCFENRASYAIQVKRYASEHAGRGRYAPPKVSETEKTVVQGDPDPDRISTSLVERSNLSIRMETRRFTRLTNAFSKKFENLCAAVALFITHYNFCRPHRGIGGVTPAMEAGLTDTVWGLEDLLDWQVEVEMVTAA